MESGDLLAERRQQWSNQGFDADAIAAHLENLGGNISESVIRLENAMVTALSLRQKVANWPTQWPERDELLEILRNPTNLQAGERKWREVIANRRPWVFTAEDSRHSWSREGRSEELNQWLERLEAIDESMTPYSNDVISAIENVSPINYIEEVVSNLEQRQIRRTGILEEMVEHLRQERGWAMTALSGNLQERYREVDRIQEMDTTLGNIEEVVDEVISIYDADVGKNILHKATLAQKMEDSTKLKTIQENAEQIGADYTTRLADISAWLKKLRENGLHINAPEHPQPSDLLNLEKQVEDVEKRVVRLNESWIKLDSLLTLFPESAGDAIALQGQVERVESVEKLLAVLETRRDEREQQSRARLNSWRDSGFEVEPLETLLNNRPRTGWLAIDEHAKKIQVCKQILATIESIDVSFDGAGEVDDWRTRITSIDVDSDDYELIQEGVTKRLRRNRWHREKLDAARITMATLWPAEINPHDLALSEYEKIIISLESGESVVKIARKSTENRVDRLLSATIAELDMWRQEGWDVSALDELVERDHVELWIQLPNLREAISNQNYLIERLLRLPLERDKNLLQDVVENSARPDQLTRLNDSIPELAKHLSALPAKDSRKINLFSPTTPRVFAKLHPLKPVLQPVIESEKPVKRKVTETVETLQTKPAKMVPTPTEIQSSVSLKTDDGDSIITTPDAPTVKWDEDVDSTGSQLDLDDSTWKGLRQKIGIPMNNSPRDVRVQRLARLCGLLQPNNGEHSESELRLISRLDKVADQLQQWTVQRLERRHCSLEGNLADTSQRLAEKLDEIPGPGFNLPRDTDETELPNVGDIEAISEQVGRLEATAKIPFVKMKDVANANA